MPFALLFLLEFEAKKIQKNMGIAWGLHFVFSYGEVLFLQISFMGGLRLFASVLSYHDFGTYGPSIISMVI